MDSKSKALDRSSPVRTVLSTGLALFRPLEMMELISPRADVVDLPLIKPCWWLARGASLEMSGRITFSKFRARGERMVICL